MAMDTYNINEVYLYNSFRWLQDGSGTMNIWHLVQINDKSNLHLANIA